MYHVPLVPADGYIYLVTLNSSHCWRSCTCAFNMCFPSPHVLWGQKSRGYSLKDPVQSKKDTDTPMAIYYTATIKI